MHSPYDPAADASIDRLREELFVRAECFLEALDGGRRSELDRLVERLTRAAESAFHAEERQLAADGARSLVRHAQEHAQFLADLEVMGDLARRGDLPALERLRPAAWLTAWLAAHGRTDREAAPPAGPRPARVA